MVDQVMRDTGAVLVPPYDHPDIILGAGTTGLEMEEQLLEARRGEEGQREEGDGEVPPHFDAVLVPLGGGGLLGGIATYFSSPDSSQQPSNPNGPIQRQPKTYIFGCEPSHQSANDAERGLASTPPRRIEHVKSLTIADGLRTPVGILNWDIVSDKQKVEGVYSVTERQIKEAMRLILERMKVVVEPSGAVGLAVALYCEGWRGWVGEMQRREREMGRDRVWDVGVVLSGGNTTVEAVVGLFGKDENEGDGDEDEGEGGGERGQKEDKEEERAKGTVGVDGEKEVEDVPG